MFQLCPVMSNDDDSQYVIFMLRRYNFDKARGVYLPGLFAMPSTIDQMVASSGIIVMDKIERAFYEIMNDSKEALEQPLESPQARLGTKGLSTQEVETRYRAVGKNAMEMDPPSIVGIFVDEIAKPFYLYQIYILWFWASVEYLSGTIMIWAMVLLTACIVSWFRFRGAQVLHRISHVNDEAIVLRDGELVTINQVGLVPGDVVKLTPGVVHCDMLLMTGETLVDESTLTGEATPQAKSPVDPRDDQKYNPVTHKKQTLSAGTSVIECDDSSFALVMKTASNTTKGEILRNVLVFRQHAIKFRSELPIVVSILATYSTFFCVFTIKSLDADFAFAFCLGM
jgi:magnesium-transporting ATPase (P-type)